MMTDQFKVIVDLDHIKFDDVISISKFENFNIEITEIKKILIEISKNLIEKFNSIYSEFDIPYDENFLSDDSGLKDLVKNYTFNMNDMMLFFESYFLISKYAIFQIVDQYYQKLNKY